MAAPARKRQRANTSGDTSIPLPTTPNTDYKSLISTFDPPTTQTLLLEAAQNHPAVAQSILTKHAQLLAAERSRVLDVDHYRKSVWRTLRDAHRIGEDGEKFTGACVVGHEEERAAYVEEDL
ncbi:MAG: hypothetical protein Q9199_003258 [Rusavskia elegans]